MTAAHGPGHRPGRPGRRPGRRPAGGDTRADILSAARTEFARAGYDGATMRGIARTAGVDAALVHHYFGTKEQVFVAVMALPFDPSEVLPTLIGPGLAGVGERVVRFFLSVWERPDSREPLLALMRSVTTNEQVAAMFRGFVSRALVGRIAASLQLPDAELRVTAAASQLVGMALLRYVIRVEPLASADEEEVVRMLAPTIQQYLTGTR